MTAEDRKLINTFEARLRSLLLKVERQEREAGELCAMVDERDQRIAALEAELKAQRQHYDDLRTARLLSVADGDVPKAKSRLNALIREIDTCIAQVKAQE